MSNRILFSDSLIFILDPKAVRVLIFNRNGKFMNSIGERGRGPGELLTIRDFIYSAERKALLLFDNKTVKEFLLDGTFIKETKTNYTPESVLQIANNRFLIEKWYYSGDEDSDYEIRLVDEHLNNIDKRIPHKQRNGKGFSFNGQTKRAENNLDHAYYFSLKGDTVFHIMKDKILPTLCIKYDKPIKTLSMLDDFSTSATDSDDYYNQIYYFEIEMMSLIVFKDKDGNCYCMTYNRETGHKSVLNEAFIPISVHNSNLVSIRNSGAIETSLFVKDESERKKVLNPHVLDSIISRTTDDFAYILKISLDIR